MKDKKFLILAVIFAVVISASAAGYYFLSKKFVLPQAPAHAQNESNDGEFSEDSAAAPDFTVIDLSGEEVSLSDYFGKPTVINFWATWCYPCKSELPHFDSLYSEYGDEINFLMVNLTDGRRDTVESVKEFVEENGFAFPVYFDTGLEAANAYGAYSIPLTVFIDENGNAVDAYLGAMNESTLRSYVESLLPEDGV